MGSDHDDHRARDDHHDNGARRRDHGGEHRFGNDVSSEHDTAHDSSTGAHHNDDLDHDDHRGALDLGADRRD